MKKTPANLSKWGRKGGLNASGAKKRRSPEFYIMLAKMGVEARKAKAITNKACG